MIQEQAFRKAFATFTQSLKQPFQWECIFFDMDGVLFDSMPGHAKSWIQTFEEGGLIIPEEEPYMNEGSTALYTVKKMFLKYLNKEATSEIAEAYKNRKHEIMSKMPDSEVMSKMPELLKKITSQGIRSWVVTGSAQSILLDRLETEFKGTLIRENMITAHDVTIGKPNPEPYLKGMLKSGFDTHQSIVIENAPLGVESAKAAGLFTIAINTGPLSTDVLYQAGADIVFSGSEELAENWDIISQILKNGN